MNSTLLSLMAADASGSANSTASMMTTIITFALIILIFYFLIIRPQKKKDKETKAMLDAMKKGDKVVTIGGIHGTVVAVKDQTVVIKVDDSARIEFSKNAISAVVNKSAEKPAPKKDKEKDKGEAVLENGGEAGSIQAHAESAPEAEAKEESKSTTFQLMMRSRDPEIVWDLLRRQVSRTQSYVCHFALNEFNQIMDGLANENTRNLRHANKDLKKEQAALDQDNSGIGEIPFLRNGHSLYDLSGDFRDVFMNPEEGGKIDGFRLGEILSDQALFPICDGETQRLEHAEHADRDSFAGNGKSDRCRRRIESAVIGKPRQEADRDGAVRMT